MAGLRVRGAGAGLQGEGVDPEQRAAIGRQIESRRAAVAAALQASYPGAPGVHAHSFFDEAPASFELEEGQLTWHVVLLGVSPEAIEVDELDDALLVRARTTAAATGWLGAVLPLPPGRERDQVEARFGDGVLVVSVRMSNYRLE